MYESKTIDALTKEKSTVLPVLQKWVKYLFWLVIINAILVLVGWQFDIELLKQPFPKLVAMNPVTAFGFVFLGIAFLVLDSKGKYRGVEALGFNLVFIPILIGVVRLLAVRGLIDFQIDLTLYRNYAEADTTGNGPGRMAITSAISFILLGLSIISLHLGDKRSKAISNYVALVVFLLALFKCIGYLYHVEEFFEIMLFDPMSVRTAISFLIASLAIITYNPTESYFSVIASPNRGGTIARLLIPFAIVVPVVFGYARLWLEWQRAIKVELGVALLITAIVLTFMVLILFASHIINKKDILKKIAERKFEGLLESAPDAMVIVNESGIIKIVNAQTEKLFEYQKSELIGQPVQMLIPEWFATDHPHHRMEFSARLKSTSIGRARELYGKKKGGREFMIDMSESPLQTEEGVLVSALIRDITERRLVDEKIRFMATIADSIQDPIITTDLNSKITRWNDAATELLAWTSEETIGKVVSELLGTTYVHDSRQQILERLQVSSFWHGEILLHAKSGKPVNVVATVSRLKDEYGGSTGHIMLMRDITEQKRIGEALSNSNVQLESANKDLESFSYSVAHDLRTPLRAVAGYSTMLSEDYGDKFDQEGQRLLEELQSNSKKMGDLIDDLLTFSRLGRKPVSKSLVDMEGLIESVLNELPHLNAQVLTGRLHPIMADGALIRQVVINLLSNAVKYSSRKNKPVIEIFSEQKGDETIYSILDNGVGFDMRFAGKLFGVFQRLHSDAEFHGTGVGLAIVQRIIQKHGGKVWATGKTNEGATFCFMVPGAPLQVLQEQVI